MKDTETSVLITPVQDNYSAITSTTSNTSHHQESGNNTLVADDEENFESLAPKTDDDDHLSTTQQLLQIPNIICIEASLYTNVFLAGFDSTVTASSYTTIGNYFNAVGLASWITTSYLITSTAFQPLYGSISDIIGRRRCVFFSIFTFSLGCLGCGVASNIYLLNLSRALTGIGSGGLINLSTIVNSDIIPIRSRGLMQAGQNLFLGSGAICGAAFGGLIAGKLGWRWCFLCQIPLCCWSGYIGYYYIQNQPQFDEDAVKFDRSILDKIDLRGAILVVAALTVILLFLSVGGNELAWTDYRQVALGLLGVALTVIFIRTELTTTARPIMPIKLYRNNFTYYLLALNFMIGLGQYAYLFALPQLFQIVLQDSASQAGLRLAIPSLSTPIGGLTTGVLMNKYSLLRSLVLAGTSIMSLGNFMALIVKPGMSAWILALLLVPANLGQGMCFPSSLFTFIFAYGPNHHATSTSTTYLLRSIGGVFGVSGVSVIIQSYLKYKVSDDLAQLGYSHQQIHKVVNSITKSTDNIYHLPSDIRKVVMMDYEDGIRIAQLFTAVCCCLAVVFCVLSFITKSRPNSSNH